MKTKIFLIIILVLLTSSTYSQWLNTQRVEVPTISNPGPRMLYSTNYNYRQVDQLALDNIDNILGIDIAWAQTVWYSSQGNTHMLHYGGWRGNRGGVFSTNLGTPFINEDQIYPQEGEDLKFRDIEFGQFRAGQKKDVVVAQWGCFRTFWNNDNNGTFVFKDGVGGTTNSVAVGNIQANVQPSVQDIVAATSWNGVQVYFNDGQGRFGPNPNLVFLPNPSKIVRTAFFQILNPVKHDIVSVTSGIYEDRIDIYKNNGNGTLANVLSNFLPGNSIYLRIIDVAIGDVNADGLEDLVVSAKPFYDNNLIYVYLGSNGSINTLNPTIISFDNMEKSDYKIRVGYIDSDNRLDLALIGTGEYAQKSAVWLFKNTGSYPYFSKTTGNYQYIAPQNVLCEVTDMQLADIDGTGRSSLIYSTRANRFGPMECQPYGQDVGQIFIHKNISGGSLTPLTISGNTVINYSYFFDRDIIVPNGAALTFSGNINIDIGANHKIEVQPGGRITASNVTFSCPSGQWEGIRITNPSSSISITNCSFNNATSPLAIYNNEQTAYFNYNLQNNTFNISGNSRAVFAKNVFNFTFNYNACNISGGSGIGLMIQNYINTQLPAGAGPGDLYNINITNNVFTGGYLQCFLGSYAMYLTPMYVYRNTFTNYDGGWCLVERMITDAIKQNTFTSNSLSAAIGLWQSNSKMYGNTVNNSYSNSVNLNVSYPLIGPSRINNQYVWVGGRNNISSGNKDNIVVQSTGYPITDWGQNSFTVNGSNYHLYGMLPDTTSTYYCRNNCWYGNSVVPHTYLWNSWSNYIPSIYQNSNYYCNEIISDQVSDIIDKGNGIYDTLYSSGDNSGFLPAADEVIYAQANELSNNANYFDAIQQYKALINGYPLSAYLYTTVSEMFNCYEHLDTSNSQAFKNSLYGDCKTYLEGKIQNDYPDNQNFIDIAYNIILICEARMDNLGGAANGYELISLYHPDPAQRLMASWDYGEIQGLINGGEGGSENMKIKNNVKTENSFIDKVNRFIDKNPTAKTVKKSFDKLSRNKSILPDKESAIDKTISDKAKENLLTSRSITKEQREQKRFDDWQILLGKPADINKAIVNNVPMRFSLYQNFPNPFNPVTMIKYDLPKDVKVTIKIYDLLGREVAALLNNEFKTAGRYSVNWDAGNYSSGVYIYRIEAGDYVQSRKMVLVK